VLSIKQELSKDCYNSRKRRFSCPQFQETETLEEFEGFFKDFVMIEPISNQTEESESTTEEVSNLLSNFNFFIFI